MNSSLHLNKKTFISSDYEGCDITSNIYLDNERNQYDLFILGDSTDSTSKVNMSNYKELLNKKSFNIRNIINIVTKDNIFLVFGNRDVNKLKCKYLTKLARELESSELVENYNNGNIVISFENYNNLNTIVTKPHDNIKFQETIKREYSVSTDKNDRDKLLLQKNWFVQSMSAWYGSAGAGYSRFQFDTSKSIIRDWTKNVNNISIEVQNNLSNKYFFYKRFQEIFGTDNLMGTMGAENLLLTIPIELGFTDSVLDNIISSNTSENINERIYNDFRAFIVLAVFNSMFVSENRKVYNFPTDKLNNPETISTNEFKGLYYNLFSNPKNSFCKYLIKENMIKNNIFLLSHGGISYDMVKHDSVMEQRIRLTSNSAYIDTSTNADIMNWWDINKFGGYYNNQKDGNIMDVNTLISRLNNINTIFKEHIDAILKNDNIISPNKELLFLFSFFGISPNLKKNAKNLSSINDKFNDVKDIYDPTSKPPIMPPSMMPGFREIGRIGKNLFINDYVLYNIFGHQPNGMSSVIDLFEHTKEDKTKYQTFEINLDTSNSFTTTNMCDLNIWNNNYLPLLSINNNNTGFMDLLLRSQININQNYDKETKKETLKEIDEIDLDKMLIIDDTIHYSKNFKKEDTLIFNNQIDISNILLLNDIRRFKKNIKKADGSIITINFNGSASQLRPNNEPGINFADKNINGYHYNDKDNLFYIISLTSNKAGFSRNMYILNYNDKEEFIKKTQETFLNDAFTGGNSYYKKYLKYKNKYLELKKL
jgi:hypothetical protein